MLQRPSFKTSSWYLSAVGLASHESAMLFKPAAAVKFPTASGTVEACVVVLTSAASHSTPPEDIPTTLNVYCVSGESPVIVQEVVEPSDERNASTHSPPTDLSTR